MTVVAVAIGAIILVLGIYRCVRDEQLKNKRRQQENERSKNNYNN